MTIRKSHKDTIPNKVKAGRLPAQHMNGNIGGGLGNGEPAFKVRKRNHEYWNRNSNPNALDNHHHYHEFDNYYNSADSLPEYGNSMSQMFYSFTLWILCLGTLIFAGLFLQELINSQHQNAQYQQYSYFTSGKKANQQKAKNSSKKKKDKLDDDNETSHMYENDDCFIDMYDYKSIDSTMYYHRTRDHSVGRHTMTRRRALSTAAATSSYSAHAPVEGRSKNHIPAPPSEPVLTSSQQSPQPSRIRTVRMFSENHAQSRNTPLDFPSFQSHQMNQNIRAIDIEYGSDDNAFKASEAIPDTSLLRQNSDDLTDEITLSDVIGSGGFGNVWQGNWRGTPVAVKLLVLEETSNNDGDEQEKINTFQSEISMLKVLRHPNVCLFLGFYHKLNEWGLVMELCENGSLWDALRQPINTSHWGPLPSGAPVGTWPSQLVLKIALGGARGMSYLHSRQPIILHRDLKSANLLLDQSYTVKIADFGLSTCATENRSKPLTQNCGTVQWMAPEVLSNDKYGCPADVYSFGIILWEMLTGECPFDERKPIEIALSIINKDERPIIPPWTSRRFSRIIERAWGREPSDRLTFEEIIQELELLEDIGGES